jgi:iron complex outermembrane receptor protein
MKAIRYSLACGTALAALLAGAHAMAQTSQQTAPQPETASSVEDVVVTARKREESLSDVPIAVTAVTSESLVRQNVLQVRDVAQMAPGLNITTDSPARAFISMRGVGVTIINTVQPGVGIFIDGIYQPNTAYLNSPLVDVERVEVLRGPQGTLFGNNTLGGAINVITRQPSNTWNGRMSATYAGPDNFRSLSGSASGPLIEDVLQFRVGAAYHAHDGFLTNRLAGGDSNTLLQQSINGSLKFMPTPWATFVLNANHDKVAGGNTPYVLASGPTDYSFSLNSNTNRTVDLAYTGVNLKGDFDLDALNTRLTIIGAYNELQNEIRGDGDYGPIDYLYGRTSTNLQTYTGEVRFDTTWSDNISTLVGLFTDRSVNKTAAVTTIVATNTNRPSSGITHIENQAVYGTVFWKFGDGWDIAAGVRWDHQELNASTATTAGVYEADEIDPRVTLTKRWSPDLMTYVSVARGSRGGGQNAPGAPNLIYQGDYVWTYELGSKLTAFNRSLSINADIFYNDYNHFIGPNALAPSTTGAGFVTVNLNAGHVNSYGFEGEVNWNVTSALNLYGSLTLLNARITDDSEFESVAGYSLPGERIPFLPDWNGLIGANYTVPLNGGDDMTFNANLVAKGERTAGSLDPNVEPVLEPYYLANASAVYHHGEMEFAIFGTNLFDEKYLENYFDKSYLSRAGFTGGLIQNLSIPGDRRRYGVRASVRF